MFSIVVVLAGMTFALAAQTPGTGAIAGVVHDPSAGVVAKASVVATNQATQISRSVRASTSGVFRIPLLAPGQYTVAVSAPGFAASVLRQVAVTVGQTAPLSVTLALAGVEQKIQVHGATDAADMEGSALGGLVNQTAIQSLPLSNRNYTQILGLSPGVVVDLPDAAALGSGTENVASDGATPLSNNIQFNGIDANNLAENSAAAAETDAGTAIPAPDTIREFRVQTANYDAAYGRGSGANVDLVSRSGTNHFHGSAWEYVRNTVLNANDYFSNLDGQPRPELKHNQFGGDIGGPIRHQHTFFFAAWQRLMEVNGLGDEQHPILPLLTNDRSAATLGAQFCPAGHPDSAGRPASGYLSEAGGVQVACDGSNINPVALAILNAKLPNGQFAIPSPQVALPTTGPNASDQVPMGQSTFALPARFHEDQLTVNIDQTVTPNNTLTGRFFWSHAPTVEPFSPNAANVPGWGTNKVNGNTMLVLADSQVLSSHLINMARFGFMRYFGLSTVQNPLTAASVGEGTPTGSTDPALAMPGLTVGGFTIGDAGTPSMNQATNSFIWKDTMAWTRGSHTLRWGAEVKRHQVELDAPEETDGLVQFATFDDFLLGGSAAQNGSPFGLSNLATTFAGAGNFRKDERYTDFAGFVQDDIALARRLTFNAGLRYEIFGAPLEINGRLPNFDPARAATGPVPAAGTFRGFTLPSNFTGPVPAGIVKTAYPSLYQTPLGDVSPRLGFAWQMFDRPLTLLRGGYGVYYDRHSATVAEQTISQPPFALSQFVSGAPNGGASLQSPFVPLVPPASGFPVFVPRTPVSFPFIEATNPHLRDGRTQEYNLNLQIALGRGYQLQAGYVGTRSAHRSGQVEFDQAALASPEKPVNGQTTNSIANVSTRMPVQGISQGSLFTDSTFIANYNALQTVVTKRLSQGLQMEASYTWSKTLDEVNGEVGTDLFELQLPTNDQRDLRHSSYGPAGTDRDQRFVANFTWTVPTLAASPAMIRRLLTDWELSGIAVIQSGIPLSIFDGNAGSAFGLLSGESRAQLAPGGRPATPGSLGYRVAHGYLDPLAFTRAPEVADGTSLADQTFGDSGVGIVRGPGEHNLDFAMERPFALSESSSLHFRVEFFNLTNTPQFGNPGTNLGYTDPTLPNPIASSLFGKITSTVANPRIIQLAIKYQF